MARGIERIGEQRRVSGTVRFDTVPTSRPGPKKESPAEPAGESRKQHSAMVYYTKEIPIADKGKNT